MFAKLLKNEWRANALTLGILNLAVLGLGLLGGFILRGLLTSGSDVSDLTGLGMTLSLVFIFLAMFGCVAAVGIILLIHFYRTKFTDQGYLTFTLPVKNTQVYFASLVHMLIWTAIGIVALLLAFLLFGVTGTVGTDLPLRWILQQLQESFSGIELPDGYWLTTILGIVVGVLYSVVITTTCLTVGATVAKKRKVLVAFAIYYGLTYVISFIDNLMSTTFDGNWATIILELVLAVAGCFVTTRLLTKKLNLP